MAVTVLPCPHESIANLSASNSTNRTIDCERMASTTIITSDQLLYLYSRIDLIILILNIIVIALPLGKYLIVKLGIRLNAFKCVHVFKLSSWNHVSPPSPKFSSSDSYGLSSTNHSHHLHQANKFNSNSNKKPYKTVTLNETNLFCENDVSNEVEKIGLVNFELRTPKVLSRNRTLTNSKLAIKDRIEEIITQTMVIILLLLYLTNLSELFMIYLSTRHKGSITNLQRFDIISLELITSSITFSIHLIEYGLIYGPSLWLASPVVVPSVSSSFESRKSDQLKYRYVLELVAFMYNAIQSFGNLFKLCLTVMLFQTHSHILVKLLKPYLFIAMFCVQFYIAGRHFWRMITINDCDNSNNSGMSTKLSQVKYRRRRSTFLSMITFTWLLDILRLGYYKNLELNDLGTLPNEEQAFSQYERFKRHYHDVNIDKHPTSFLWRVCWRTYKYSLIFGALVKIFSDLSSLIGPISIGYILNYISEASNQPRSTNNISVKVVSENLTIDYVNCYDFIRNAYVMTIVVLISTFLQSTFSNNFNHLVISEGIHLKTALNCFIYHKALRMPISNSEHIDIGIISNYMSTDSSNIFQFFTMMHYLWAVPIKIVILLYLLYQQMGISALIGAAIFFILSPFQYYCSRKISQIQKLQMDISDQRLSKTTELFMGIKLLKLLGWDLSFADHIKRFRKSELEYLRKDAIFVAVNTFITQGSAILVTMITFNLFPYIEKKPLTSATVFTSIALFNQITTPLYIVPLVIPMLVSAIVSHRRLVDYLRIPELKTDYVQWEDQTLRLRDIAPNSAPILQSNQHRMLDRSQSALYNRPSLSSSIMNDLCCFTKNGKFAWYDEIGSESTLCNINVHLPREKLTIVVGSIGSGKSTFLASLIGETYLVEGELHWLEENQNGYGYVPSNPWILNVSLQENITFGRSYERKRYVEVVKACCLQADIDLLPCGDQTIIGERGINLSGGQKQRIALARAIYSNTSTLILDDCISALDPIVGYSVFDNAIMRLAIKCQRRTVILATHKHEFLSNADYVIAIDSGTIKCQGTFQQLEKEDKAFFHQWSVIKEKETRERMGQPIRSCKTIEERNKLVRLLSKKGEFRGSIKRDMSNRFKRKSKGLSRQMSYDASNALPCHEWAECEDIIHESELEVDERSFTATNNLNRLVSSESENSKQSYLSLASSNSATFADTNLNSVTSTQTLNNYSTPRPPILRLNSRISNYSVQADPIIEEETDTPLLCCKHNCSREDCGCGSTQILPKENDYENEHVNENDDEEKEDDDEEDEYKPSEDNTQEVNNELLFEIITFNENQVETATIYNADTNPQKNQISIKVYMAYLRAHSYHLAAFVLLLIILNQTIKVISDFWLAKWTDSDEKILKNDDDAEYNQQVIKSKNHENLNYYIYTYSILSLISILVSLSANISAQLIAIRAVRLFHDKLIDVLVRCPLRFFDKTPIGCIMNRFTNDINVIDKKLPIAIPVLLRFFFLCLSAIVVNIIITPYFLLAIIPILVIYYYLQKLFRCTSRQLQRLELASKAPIISHFNQTIDGITTIRAFHEQIMFRDKFFQLLDVNNLCFLMVNSVNCCFGIFLDYLGGIILFIATLISIIAALHWNVQSAFVGLAMTYTLLVPVYLNWLVRNLASVEMNMNSVERIYRYTQLEIEDSCLNNLKESDKGVPSSWPKTGEIEFNNVSIRYETNFEPIIKNANIHIRSGEKIGICGRTGCGKSSLIGALFRINEICKGTIKIDGQDITHVCPYKLRKKLSIIPQDMVLFSGTIRENLDPGKCYSDEEIWNVLKDFRLNKSITSLEEEVNDESSLSSGARQLLCCARAFLRDSPLLIMDESTSLLDPKSERLVLEQIFRSNKTIIAIAHRIMNIANFDKVLVVNEGRVVEFDTPENLLRKQHSIFYSLYHKQNYR